MAAPEMIREGIARVRAEGASWGRPKTAGRNDDAIRSLRARGMKLREISEKLGVPLTTIARVLKSKSS